MFGTKRSFVARVAQTLICVFLVAQGLLAFNACASLLDGCPGDPCASASAPCSGGGGNACRTTYFQIDQAPGSDASNASGVTGSSATGVWLAAQRFGYERAMERQYTRPKASPPYLLFHRLLR